MDWQTELAQAIAALDQRELQAKFQFHNEFLVVEQFLPEIVLKEFLSQLPCVQSVVHRNYIPGHKKDVQ